MRLTGMVLKIWDHGRWFGEGNEGSAQESPLSPLLNNVVLDELERDGTIVD